MATGGETADGNSVAADLNKFLQVRGQPNEKVDNIVSRSRQRAEVERKHSADADDLSRREKERKLDLMLQKQRYKKRKKSRLTVTDVRNEAAKILEEFLQSQLLEQSVQTRHDPRYQRYMEMDIAEETTHSGESTGYFASHSTLEREESIPYADDSDMDGGYRKAGSLPQDDMLITMYGNKSKPGVEIIHAKSRSAPYKGDETVLPSRPNSKYSGLRPPPPPPPGTPFSPSDASGTGSKESLGYVPYTGFTTDSGAHASSGSSDWLGSQGHVSNDQKVSVSPDPYNQQSVSNTSIHNHSHKHSPPKVPTSLDLPSNHSKSRPSTPRSESGSKSSSPTKFDNNLRKTRQIKSGSVSSSDSDSDPQSHLKDRKKKPFYKKAQERFQTLIHRKKDHSPDRDENHSSQQQVVRKKQKKKPKKEKKLESLDNADNHDRASVDLLEDRHIHINKHIHQTHTGDDKSVLVRTEESTEVTDITSDSERKHVEKRMKVKESTEGGKGFFGRIRRMTSREKGKRKMKGSKSSDFQSRGRADTAPVQFGRGLSVPGHRIEDESDIHVTHIERGDISPNHTTVKARQVVDRRDDIKRHSSHLDIVDHDGSLVERVFFDEEGNDLPRNESFDLIQDTYVHEREVVENGRVKVIRDVSTHDHMVISDNEETSGATGGRDLSEMTDREKEELYGKIAGRLAMIGDNIMTERGENVSGASKTPVSKTSSKDSPSPDEETKRAHLSQLEAEIRDELIQVADEIDARLAANARQAAMRIAGVVAYDQFSQVVDEQVNKEVGWAQVAAVFNITKRAIQVAGASGSLAMQIKEMSLKYIENKFASWIVDQGGWDSMLSGTDTDTDSELD